MKQNLNKDQKRWYEFKLLILDEIKKLRIERDPNRRGYLQSDLDYFVKLLDEIIKRIES